MPELTRDEILALRDSVARGHGRTGLAYNASLALADTAIAALDREAKLIAERDALRALPLPPEPDPPIVAVMEAALRLHQAWSDSESAGPDYGEQSRTTHPDGERIWEAWWYDNLSLCDGAQKATIAALANLAAYREWRKP